MKNQKWETWQVPGADATERAEQTRAAAEALAEAMAALMKHSAPTFGRKHEHAYCMTQAHAALAQWEGVQK